MRSNLRGGNANVLPLEYFGGNSGRYGASFGSAPAGNNATSHGMSINENFAGPDLNVYEGQVGGARRRRRSRVSRRSNVRRSARRTVRRSARRRSSVRRSARRSSVRRSSRRSSVRRSARRSRIRRRVSRN